MAGLSVAREGFLQQALLVGYSPAPQQPDRLPPPKNSSAFSMLSRGIFRAQIGSERGKRARWMAETRLMPKVGQIALTRNTLLNEPVAALADRDLSRTDILHEYFVAPDRLNDFLAACREIIPSHRQDLLNVTLRYVDANSSSVLTYALQPRIAAVMLFVQKRTAEADDDMRAMTVQADRPHACDRRQLLSAVPAACDAPSNCAPPIRASMSSSRKAALRSAAAVS